MSAAVLRRLIGWCGYRLSLIAGAMAGAQSVTSPAVASIPSMDDLATEVWERLNAARVRPDLLIDDLRLYRAHFSGTVVRLPSTGGLRQTEEGVTPVEEAAAFLSREMGRPKLIRAGILTAAATRLVTEQGRSGGTGHSGHDGSGPAERAAWAGGGRMVTEVIAYGAGSAADVVRQLIVGDGVPDRDHRRAVFDGQFRFAGVACGRHPVFGTMCVIELADTHDARPANIGR